MKNVLVHKKSFMKSQNMSILQSSQISKESSVREIFKNKSSKYQFRKSQTSFVKKGLVKQNLPVTNKDL